ncbi:MAG: tRNA (5-methylaminomethyl-2-thiouridine)(34)-methyltransferase MnmD [Pleurocapsa sp.]
MSTNRIFSPQPTEDGSYTFYSQEFQEAFHSSFGAKQEAEVRYIEPCKIKQLATKKSHIRLLDICYGLGYNSAAALEAIWSVNPECKVELIALEISADVPRQAIKHHLLDQWRSPVPILLSQLGNKSVIRDKYLVAELLLGDARHTIQSVVKKGWQADAIFLDPFSPRKCPQLWTVEFIGLIGKCLISTGRLATYSCSAAVRTALIVNNFQISSITGAGRKSPGTLAQLEYKTSHLLSQKENEHLQTRAAIPYRDRNLNLSAKEIISKRNKEQHVSNLESTSQWRKRWLESHI